MTSRVAIPAIYLCLTLAAARSQTPASETPPDTRAYAAANAIADPEKKIEALLQLKSSFPNSPLLPAADQAVLTTLVKKLPGQPERIRRFAAAMYRRTPAGNRGAIANTIATQFLNAGVLLEDARRYAGRSLRSRTSSSYVREQLAAYERRGQTPPWSQDIEKRYREFRAGRLGTLGRIEWKLGHTAAALRLLEEAHAALPDNMSVQATLGEIAAAAGDYGKAFELLVPVQLNGAAPAEATAALESIYRKRNGDSLAGFDAMLDAEYHKRFPNPVPVERYRANATRSDRTVLAEVFTGSACGPCAGPDLAFDAVMLRYPRKDLAVIMYHQHIPRPDPMTSPGSQARHRNYAVTGIPTFAVDGKKVMGGGPRESARITYDQVLPGIERGLATPAEATLAAEASLTGNTVRVKASVRAVKSGSSDLKLHIALVEKELRFSGENGIRFHPMVVRAMAGKDAAGFALGAAPQAFEQSFDLDAVSQSIKAHLDSYEAAGHRGEPYTFARKMYQIDRNQLAVVVFVQDDQTKHVLQSAYVEMTALPLTQTGGVR